MDMISAAQQGNLAQVKKLVCQGAPIDVVDNNGDTALHHACARAHASMVAYLLSSGAATTGSNDRGQTARDLADVSGDRTVVALFGLSLGRSISTAADPKMQVAKHMVHQAQKGLHGSSALAASPVAKHNQPLSEQQVDSLKQALGPSLVGQMERLGLVDELQIMASKLQWQGAEPPPQREFRESSIAPKHFAPTSAGPTPAQPDMSTKLHKAISAATVDSMRAKFMEKQLDNRLSPESKAFIKSQLSASMDPAQVSPPATPPLPARPVPAADPQQQVLPPVDMWTVPSVHSAEPPPQREFRELPAQPTVKAEPVIQKEPAVAAPAEALDEDPVQVVKQALLSDQLSQLLSPPTVERIRHALTPAPSVSYGMPYRRSYSRSPPSRSPPRVAAFPPVVHPAHLAAMEADPLSPEVVEMVRAHPAAILAAPPSAGACPQLLATVAGVLMGEPVASYGLVLQRVVSRLQPEMTSALVVVADTARRLHDPSLKSQLITLMLSRMGIPASHPPPPGAPDPTILLDAVVAAIETVATTADKERLLDTLLQTLSAEAKSRSVPPPVPYPVELAKPPAVHALAHAREMTNSVQQVLQSRVAFRAANIPKTAQEARERFAAAHAALEQREHELVAELENASNAAGQGEQALLQEAQVQLQACESTLMRTPLSPTTNAVSQQKIEDVISRCQTILDSARTDARLWIETQGQSQLFDAISQLGKVSSALTE